jgi:hypothetical protein
MFGTIIFQPSSFDPGIHEDRHMRKSVNSAIENTSKVPLKINPEILHV